MGPGLNRGAPRLCRGEVRPSRSGSSLSSPCPPRPRTLHPTPGEPLPDPLPAPPLQFPELGYGRRIRPPGGRRPRPLPPFLALVPGENVQVVGMGGDRDVTAKSPGAPALNLTVRPPRHPNEFLGLYGEGAGDGVESRRSPPQAGGAKDQETWGEQFANCNAPCK